MKNIVVIYHDDLDGFGAAWAAWKKFGNKADYFSADYADTAPVMVKGKELYMLDFGYSKKIMEALLEANKKFVLIDHHITRTDTVKILKEYVWDVKRSGCALAWEYFHPDKKIPKMLEYIEDYDLWKFKFKNTRELTIFLESAKRDFKAWNKFAADIENKKKFVSYLEKGEIILNFTDKLVKFLASNAKEAIFEGKRAMVVNSPIFNSEIGNYLINKTKKPIAVIWSVKNGQITVSLRSSKQVDVSKISRKYKGGGHKQAAGFELKMGERIPWKIIE